MPVRLPDIPGLSPTAINAAPMSAKAAGAPAAALGDLAQGFASMGGAFSQHAEKIQATENARALSEARTTLDTERTQFLVDLDKDPDPANHLRRTQEFLQKQKSIIDRPEYSQAVRDKLIPYYDEWAGNTRNQIAVSAGRLSQNRAKLAMGNELKAAYDANDLPRAKRAFDDAVGAGVRLPEEWNGIESDFAEKQRKEASAREINDDPNGWLERNPRPPEEGKGSLVEWQNNMQAARQQLRTEVSDSDHKFNDMLVTGALYNEKQVEDIFGDMPPSVQHEYRERLKEWGQGQLKARMQSPEGQAEAIGQATSLLSSYVADGGNDITAQSKASFIIDQLPDSPSKRKLKADLDAAVTGRKAEIKNRADQSEADLKFMLEQDLPGLKGGTMKTSDALDAGFLKNSSNLKIVGYNDDQIKEILSAKTEAERKRIFQSLWSQRGKADANVDPVVWRTSEAIRDGRDSIDTVDPATVLQSRRALGKVLMDMQTWNAQNPDAPQEKIDAKLKSLIGDQKVINYRKTSMLDPMPGTNDPAAGVSVYDAPGVLPPKETSFVPPKGSRITYYGYASDEHKDGYSKNGIGSFTTKADAEGPATAETRLRAGDIAVSPDVESALRSAGVSPKEEITVTLADGTTHTGRWMDRTSDKLSGRIDLYDPTGARKWDGAAVIGWSKM